MTGMLSDKPDYWCKCNRCRDRGHRKVREHRRKKRSERQTVRLAAAISIEESV